MTNSRFFASLFTIFGSLAILLAMVGVYGVMSWVVGQRTGEFGIRMALGARARDIVAMLLGQSLRPILLGVVLGVLGGFGLSRALNAMFWRMTAVDPVVFVGDLGPDAGGGARARRGFRSQRVTRIDPAAGAALRVARRPDSSDSAAGRPLGADEERVERRWRRT